MNAFSSGSHRSTGIVVGSTAANATMDAWVALQLISSNIGLPVLVATFLFSKNAKRHPTLINVCIMWIFSGIISLLLFYAGQNKGPEPDKGLCIAQTTLLYGMTPMWSVGLLMLMYYMRSCHKGDGKPKFSATKLTIMLALPYVTYLAFSLPTGIISSQHPELVDRHRLFFYCSLHYKTLSDTMQGFTLFVCFLVEVVQIEMAITMYRNWRGIREAGHSGGIDIHVALRVLAFNIYIFLSMIFDVVSLATPTSPVPNMFAATIGLALFLIYGSQPDVLRAWLFWRRKIEVKEVVQLPRGSNLIPQLDPTKIDIDDAYNTSLPSRVYAIRYPNLLA